jgi:hypothetical protein
MSLPAAMSGQVMSGMAVLSPFDGFLQVFNTNPYFIGLMMLILNFGGRFISLEITKKQELFLQHPWVRRCLIFTVLFIGTRSIAVSFWATVIVVLLLGYLFNENSSLCLFGKGGAPGSSCANGQPAGDGMTPEEKEILMRLSSKAQRYQKGGLAAGAAPPSDEEDDVLHTDIYAANVALLKQ